MESHPCFISPPVAAATNINARTTQEKCWIESSVQECQFLN